MRRSSKADQSPMSGGVKRRSRGFSTTSRKGSRSRSGGDNTRVIVESPSVYVQNVMDKAHMGRRLRLVNRVRGVRGKRTGATLGDGSAIATDHDGDEEEGMEDDQYMNYEVSFTYRRTSDMRTQGTGLHMLTHFGWGVKGVGGSEIPVYIDIVELRGTVRVRVLLSPSPPFAREASFSFVRMPDFEISAKPLRTSGLGSFNAMDIPLLKSYVQKSIAQVAAAFVAPKHYHMDVERLLLGQDSSLRTRSIGVFYIIIHECHGLPRTDTIGSCDPYVAISYDKFKKPRECLEEAKLMIQYSRRARSWTRRTRSLRSRLSVCWLRY